MRVEISFLALFVSCPAAGRSSGGSCQTERSSDVNSPLRPRYRILSCSSSSVAAAPEISGTHHTVVLSAGTDGTDGPTDAAGAIADNTTVKRAALSNLNAQIHLNNNDSYHFFKKMHDLYITGPTNTNVMDLRIILID